MRGPMNGSSLLVVRARDGVDVPAAAALTALPQFSEAVVLATCHRTEFYLAQSGGQPASRLPCPTEGAPLTGGDAVEHLIRVAAGLDSPILGDGQVLRQVRRAYLEARHAGATGPRLNRLFETALRAGKQARRLTAFGRGAMTTPSAAAALADRLVGGVAGRRALVIGAGDTARLVAQHLARRRAVVTIANRSLDRAAAVARAVHGEAITLDGLEDALARCELVISATAAPHPVIGVEVLRRAMTRRAGTLVAIDLAVPPDIDPECGTIRGVVLIDLAAVVRDADADRAARAAAIPAVEAIVAEHRARYDAWLAGAGAADVIRSLRAHVAQARARAVAAVPLEHDRRQFERQTRRTMNRVLHRTVVDLKSLAGTPHGQARLSQWRSRLVPPADRLV